MFRIIALCSVLFATVSCTRSGPDYFAEIMGQVIEPCTQAAILKNELYGSVTEEAAYVLALERNRYLFGHITKELGRQVSGFSLADRQTLYSHHLATCIARAR